jgi:uncharacterized RDD family membrane protein YckC
VTAAQRPRPTDPEDFPATGPFSLASIPQRALGRVMDLVVVALPFALATLPFLEIEGDEVRVEGLPWWFAVAQVAAAIAYDTVAVALWGRTLGKVATGTRVVRYVDGERPPWSRALQRTLLPNAAGAVPIPLAPALEAAVYLSAVSHPLRRGWHDRSAGTLVVRTR